MPRANRHYLPGYIWHITHRCHKQEYLLKLSKDKQCWLNWLFEAKKRFDLCILNYVVTSNHIHLLVFDTKEEVIPKSIQLIAGRTAQAYNQRKGRKGAFWEDRYHATAVQNDNHFAQCLTYIDLNMVRAGVVIHPEEWLYGGYNEIQEPKARYSRIDREKLMSLFGIKDSEQLTISHRKWVEEVLGNGSKIPNEKWSRSIAVGTKAFLEETKQRLGIRAKGRKIVNDENSNALMEEQRPYGNVFNPKKDNLSLKNTCFWNV